MPTNGQRVQLSDHGIKVVVTNWEDIDLDSIGFGVKDEIYNGSRAGRIKVAQNGVTTVRVPTTDESIDGGLFIIGEEPEPYTRAVFRVLHRTENLNASDASVHAGMHNILYVSAPNAFTAVYNGADLTCAVPRTSTGSFTGGAGFNGLWVAPVWDATADCTNMNSIVADSWIWPGADAPGSNVVTNFTYFHAGFDDGTYGGGVSIQQDRVTNLYGMQIPAYTKGAVNNVGLKVGAMSTATTRNLSIWSEGTVQVDTTLHVGVLGSTSLNPIPLLNVGNAAVWNGSDIFAQGVAVEFTVSADAVESIIGVSSIVKTAAAATTHAAAIAFFAGAPVAGAASTISNSYGVYVADIDGVGVTAGIGIYITGSKTLAFHADADDVRVDDVLQMGAVSARATTKGTATAEFKEGTAPVGTATTTSAIFASSTLMRKINAAGTASNIEA